MGWLWMTKSRKKGEPLVKDAIDHQFFRTMLPNAARYPWKSEIAISYLSGLQLPKNMSQGKQSVASPPTFLGQCNQFNPSPPNLIPQTAQRSSQTSSPTSPKCHSRVSQKRKSTSGDSGNPANTTSGPHTLSDSWSSTLELILSSGSKGRNTTIRRRSRLNGTRGLIFLRRESTGMEIVIGGFGDRRLNCGKGVSCT